MSQHTIIVHGQLIDLEDVYRRMLSEARPAADGRLIHDRGMKYLLADMFGLTADHRTPKQPLASMRVEVVESLQRLGWIERLQGKNNGRYSLRR